MRFADVLLTALTQIRANKLRSFFTLLGIIVSVAFLVAVIAIIQGMNAYVKENVANAMIGSNTFQVRRTPINLGLIETEEWRRMQRRPKITYADAEVVRNALPDAEAISITSGWPTPQSDVVWHERTLGDVLVFGVSPEHQVVQDYRFSSGEPLNEIDVRQRRNVAVIGADVAKKLFEEVEPVGREVRIRGELFTIIGVVAPKGRVLGQSFDGFVLMPITTFESIYGRRQTTTISVKMPTALEVTGAMTRAEEAMRVAHQLRPGQEPDFSLETADALVSFWKQLTSVLFAVVPAMVAIGIVVGGIVIMNIMLMSVKERTHEIGLRKSVGATHRDIRRQFLAEATMLATIGGAMGALGGWLFAGMIAAVSPLPARVTIWSIMLALGLGAGVGVLFGVYPADRASRLDPVNALRAE
ncbi:MAG TPA: ABC transporter permease [Gemmatimonadaceae bacterium]|nr:ABC transporter permease [Gemmatimonadaceae bacterium]